MSSYFWVNQGSTYDEERVAGLLWAPERTGSGSKLVHWETMGNLLPADVVFNYANGAIRSYAVVSSVAVSMTRPYDAGSAYSPAQGGRAVMCGYVPLRAPISLATVTANEAVKLALQSGHNPVLDRRGAVAQKYLCAIPTWVGHVLASLAGCEPQAMSQQHARLTSTEVSRLIDARLGQGKFRYELLDEFHGTCAVTGLAIPELLRASHIKAWTQADNHERLDRNNGLLLAAGVDAAFDRGFIGFDASGELKVSARISSAHRTALGIPTNHFALNPAYMTIDRRRHLEFHRSKHRL